MIDGRERLHQLGCPGSHVPTPSEFWRAVSCSAADTASPAPTRAKLRAQVMLFFGMINWSHTWFDPAHGLSRAELARQAADTALNGLTP